MTKKTTLDDTGERMIPKYHGNTIMYAEHMTRYIAAQKLAEGKVVLDIASGSGYGTKMLAEKAKKVYGVDISEEAVKYAKENFSASNIEFLKGNGEHIPLPDNSIDLVVTFETIEHIEHYETFIQEVKRVLKPNGLAIVSTPNDEEFAEGNHFHLHEFKYTELRKLLGKYFSDLKAYHQATWAYVQISDEDYIGTNNAVTNVEVHNFSPLSKKKYLYFYMLCSNRRITESIDNLGGLGGHYSARELGDIFAHYQKQIEDHKEVNRNEEDAHRKTKIKLKAKEREIHAITQSTSYKIARTLALSKHGAKVVVNRAKDLNPKRVRMLSKNKKHVKAMYESADFHGQLDRTPTADLAVIIHLYYPEMLSVFVDKLKSLEGLKYDLYITIPESKGEARERVLAAFPDARVAIAPNCGRDVLPFVQVMKHVEKHGYAKILKLHSKRSPHREDGEEWRDKILDSLLPIDTNVVKEIVKNLGRKKTAVIGPEGEYVSLLVNFSATGHYVKNLVGKIVDTKLASDLVNTSDEYGFFAGTMFWARTDAIMPIIHSVEIGNFEPELGQEDSTLAHALERLFSVIPELQGKTIYEVQKDKVVKLNYHTSNIPEWSEVALEE